MVDDDVLLGELIVRAGILSREGIARALIEVSRRRSQGSDSDLSLVLISAGLIDRETLERYQREARGRPRRDEELSRALRNAYDSVDEQPIHQSARPASFPAMDALPQAARAKKPTGRFDPAPPPKPSVLPTVPALSTAPTAKMIGRTWGPYEILSEVARGAMGAVYRARDGRRGGQEVALKVLLQGSKADLEDVERFQREARSLKRLNHPSIVRFYDYGVHEGCPFVAMDFVAGTTFESIMTGGALPVEKGLVILEEVARAVDHAHAHGVVHRDLKPANVLIGADGRARITDFGLAKILDEGTNLTRSGDLIGTPLYMSPEQIRGDLSALGPSSDVWSLGVTLYLLLTGQQPFGAKTIDEVAHRVKTEEPIPPRTLKPELSPELEKIVLAALTKDPARRYQSAGEFSSDLRNYLHGKPVLAGRVTIGIRLRRFTRSLKLKLGIRPLVGMVVAVVVAFGSVGLYTAFSRKEPAGLNASQAKLKTLRDLVAALADPRAEGSVQAAKNLETAHRAVLDALAPGQPDGEVARETDNLLARGHMFLAQRPPPRCEANDWAATELLAAARHARDLVHSPGSSVDKRTALEQAVERLARVHEKARRDEAWKLVQALGEEAAGPLLTARASALAGDWAHARAVLESALERGAFTRSERDAAIDLELEALLGLDANVAALDRARSAAAEASTERDPDGAPPGARVSQLELFKARALRATPKGAADGEIALAEIEARLAALERKRPQPSVAAVASLASVRDALRLEKAHFSLDAGMPAAALFELARLKEHESDPRAILARARAHLLAGTEAAIAEDRARLLELLAAPGLPPSVAAEAALALDDMSVLVPPTSAEAAAIASIADLSRFAPPRDGPRPVPETARRVAFALAAPLLASAVRVLSQEWSRPAGKEWVRQKLDSAAAVAVLEPLAKAGDLEAQSWMLVLAHADVDAAHRGSDLDRLGRAVSAPPAGERGSDVARLAHALDLIVNREKISAGLWDETTGASRDSMYDITARLEKDRPETKALVALAGDKIALFRASLPLQPEGTAIDVSLRRAEHEKLLGEADRALELAMRREPLAASVRRARAQLELARAQLVVARGGSTEEAHRTLLSDAAAAVLLDPFNLASTAALARNTLACNDDSPEGRLWAGRALDRGRGARSEVETALFQSILGPPTPLREPPVVELRAWLAFLSGKPTQTRFDEAAHLRRTRPELPVRSPGAARTWAGIALNYEGATDEAFQCVSPAADDGPGDRDAADALVRGVRHVLACETALRNLAESEREGDPATELALARAALEDALERRPDAAAPRIFLDYARALAGTEAEVVEARADIERLRPILAARAARLGPDQPSPALAAVVLLVANVRLATTGDTSGTDERVAKLFGRAECRGALAHWKLLRGR